MKQTLKTFAALVLCLFAVLPGDAKSSRSKKDAIPANPIPPGEEAVLVTLDLMNTIVNNEVGVRAKISDRAFFRKALCDQEGKLNEVLRFLRTDPFRGHKVRFDTQTDSGLQAKRMYEAYSAYMVRHNMRQFTANLVGATRLAFFDTPARIEGCWRFYTKSGPTICDNIADADVGLDEFCKDTPKKMRAWLTELQKRIPAEGTASPEKIAEARKAVQRDATYLKLWKKMGWEDFWSYAELKETKPPRLLPSAKMVKQLRTLEIYNGSTCEKNMEDWSKRLRDLRGVELAFAHKGLEKGEPELQGCGKVAKLGAADRKLQQVIKSFVEDLEKTIASMRDSGTLAGKLRTGKGMMPKLQSRFGSMEIKSDGRGPAYLGFWIKALSRYMNDIVLKTRQDFQDGN